MDPITATTTIITLATFLKDLIELGQSIRESIEKVSENRRRLRELIDDILRSLVDIANLTRGHDDKYMVPTLLAALGDLKADLLHVLDICLEMQPTKKATSKFRGLGSHVKMWMKREKIGNEIRRLREHVMSCYIKFMAFSTARIEQTQQRVESAAGASMEATLRMEHRVVVHHAENQGRLRHIEGMMARVLLEEPYGQGVMKKTVEIMSSDLTHTTLEFQYLSVQTLHLVDSLQRLFVGGRLKFQSKTDLPPMGSPVLLDSKPMTATHILHRILGMLLRLHNSNTNQGLRLYLTDFDHQIEVDLGGFGLISEAIAWSAFATQMFKHLVASGGSVQDLLPRISPLQYKTVLYYQHQMRYELALQTSEQALLDWQAFRKSSHMNIHWQMWGVNLRVANAHMLKMNKCSAEALPLAQVAVSLSHPLVAQLIASGAPVDRGTPEEFTVVTSAEASFVLGDILSSLNRHMEAYEASKDGFKTLLEFSGSIQPPGEKHIDTFIHRICILAEGGNFTLQMLHDSILLVRSLAHRYRESFALEFFHLICAHICLITPDSDILMKDLRKLLEPQEGKFLPPSFNIQRIHHVVHDLHSYGGPFVEDVIRIYYLNSSYPPDDVETLVKYAFGFHFDESITVLRDVVSSLLMDPSLSGSEDTICWAFDNIQDTVIPSIPPKNRLAVIEVADSILAHYRRTHDPIPPFGRDRVSRMIAVTSWSFWSAGLLDNAVARMNEAIERRCSHLRKDDTAAAAQLLKMQVRRSFVVYDTGGLFNAIQAAQIHWTSPTKVASKLRFLHLYLLQARILRRIAKYEKALTLLTTVISDAEKDPKLEARLDRWFPTVLAELAVVRSHLDQSEKTLEQVEQAIVVARQRDAAHATKRTKYSLVRYLLILADCLARIGRDEEALASVEEATSMYIENETDMWWNFIYSPRARQELGSECFYSLSLRLAATGKLEAALEQAEKATELYREIASLAPVELPSLARSLRHHASILQRLHRREEALAAYEEATDILRTVSKIETPFLPDLEDVLKDILECEPERATIQAELAEVRKRIQVAAAEPYFPFVDFAPHFLEDEDSEGDEDYATATESSGDEYEDAQEIV